MNRFFKQSKIKLYTSWQDYAFAILYFFTGNFFFKGSTNKLENFISKKFDKNCIALPQSRTGLYFVLKYYHKPGGNVIVSSYTVSVVINTIIVSGLKPIFVDIDKKSFNAKIDVIKKSINSKTVAIIATHFFGLDCEVEKIKKFSNKFKIPIIEDAAQAFGTKDAGLKGEVGLYSFGLLKNCTSFYGGILVTDNDDLAKNIRKEINSLQIFPFFLLSKRIIFAFFIEIITNRKVFNLFIFPILKI